MLPNIVCSEGVFLFMCDPSMDELCVTWTHTDLCIDLSRFIHSSFIEESHMTQNTASANSITAAVVDSMKAAAGFEPLNLGSVINSYIKFATQLAS